MPDPFGDNPIADGADRRTCGCSSCHAWRAAGVGCEREAPPVAPPRPATSAWNPATSALAYLTRLVKAQSYGSIAVVAGAEREWTLTARLPVMAGLFDALPTERVDLAGWRTTRPAPRTIALAMGTEDGGMVDTSQNRAASIFLAAVYRTWASTPDYIIHGHPFYVVLADTARDGVTLPFQGLITRDAARRVTRRAMQTMHSLTTWAIASTLPALAADRALTSRLYKLLGARTVAAIQAGEV